MSTVPPGPYSQPAPQVPASELGAKRVSPAGYWIAGAVFVVGGIAALVWFVIVIVGAINAPNDFARVGVPGQMRVELGTGEWYLYQEAPNIRSAGGSIPVPDVVVTDAAGDEVFVRSSGTSYNYETNDHEGESIGSFDVDTAGVYTIAVAGEARPSQTIAVGRSLFSGAIPGILGSMALGAVAFLVALVLLIVTLVRRSKAKRARARATGYPGGAGAYPGAAPPHPGYPASGYPAAAYPPPSYPSPAPGTAPPPPPSSAPAPPAPAPPAPAPPAPAPPAPAPPASEASPGWAAPQPPPPPDPWAPQGASAVPPPPPPPPTPSVAADTAPPDAVPTGTDPTGAEPGGSDLTTGDPTIGDPATPEPEAPPAWSPPKWSPPGDDRTDT